MNSPLLPRHIIWRRSYDAQRYAFHLSQEELNLRIRDIVLNLMNLNLEAKIDFGPVTEERAVWVEKWTHMLEEMQLRYGAFPAGFTRDILHSTPFPNYASELADNAAKRLTSMRPRRRNVLIKFGKATHMKRLYESGSARIQPASFFAQAGYNEAIRDDELQRFILLELNRDDVVRVVKNPQDVPDTVPALVQVNVQFPTDYWLYCVTCSTGPRLFVDFDADACVIIYDADEFSHRLHRAGSALATSVASRGRVSYLDPLLPSTAKIHVPFFKHFRYTYQNEYRFCWFPQIGTKKLPQLDIEIGPLRDIADLVLL